MRLPASVAGLGEALYQGGGVEVARQAVDPPAAFLGGGGGRGADRGEAQRRRQSGAALGDHLDGVRAGEHQPVEARQLGERLFERPRVGGRPDRHRRPVENARAGRPEELGERTAWRLVAGHHDGETAKRTGEAVGGLHGRPAPRVDRAPARFMAWRLRGGGSRRGSPRRRQRSAPRRGRDRAPAAGSPGRGARRRHDGCRRPRPLRKRA